MVNQIAIFFFIVILSTVRSIQSYIEQQDKWKTCPYPVGLWYCIVVVTFNSNIFLSIISYSCLSARNSFKYCITAILALAQVFFLVWNVIGTVWAVLTIYKDPGCMPEQVHEVIIETIASYFLWVLDTIFVCVAIALMLEPIFMPARLYQDSNL